MNSRLFFYGLVLLVILTVFYFSTAPAPPAAAVTPSSDYSVGNRLSVLEDDVRFLRRDVERLSNENVVQSRSIGELSSQIATISSEERELHQRLMVLEGVVFTETGDSNEPSPTPTPTNTPTPSPTPTDTPTPTPTPLPVQILGVRVASEDRCSPYDPEDYSYSPALEQRIADRMEGIIYSPYTGQTFYDFADTDIEHIVARSEAHDSGLCAASLAQRRAFANDLENLTLADPTTNRHVKSNKDLAEWVPIMNVCWFTERVRVVKKKYNLTWDIEEAERARGILEACPDTKLQIRLADGEFSGPEDGGESNGEGQSDPLSIYDVNGDGRITCAEARAAGIAPVPTVHPAYEYMDDRDKDGVVCE